MSYILCLGFKSVVYKIPPTIKVSLNNLFIDEFEIDHNNHTHTDDLSLWSEKFWNIYKTKQLGPFPTLEQLPTNFNNFFNEMIFYKFFELDEKVINTSEENKLAIEFFTDSNNYTNGFLTKSTMVSLYISHLIPKTMLENFNESYKEYTNTNQKLRAQSVTIEEIKKFYTYQNSGTRTPFFDLFPPNKKFFWHDQLNNITKEFHLGEWLGGIGDIILPFKSEVLDITNDIKKFKLDEVMIHALKNKYIEYENQRNNH